MQNPQLDGEPFLLERGPVGALLLHGYTQTPAGMRPLGEMLAARGYTVSAPRLPGHGTTPADLARVRWREWAAAAESAFDQLLAGCRIAFACGESLGGLLALRLGVHHPDVAGVVAFSPAVGVTSRLIRLAPLLKYVVKTRPKHRGGRGGVADELWQGYTVDVTAAAAQLLALQRVVRREARWLRVPLLVVQGRLDTTVDQGAVAAYVGRVRSPDKALIYMEGSGHCVTIDEEREDVARLTAEFVARVGGVTLGGQRDA